MTAAVLALAAGSLAAWLLDPWCRPPTRRPGVDTAPGIAPDAAHPSRHRPRTVTIERSTLLAGGTAVAAVAALTVTSPPVGLVTALAAWVAVRRTAVRRRRRCGTGGKRPCPN